LSALDDYDSKTNEEDLKALKEEFKNQNHQLSKNEVHHDQR